MYLYKNWLRKKNKGIKVFVTDLLKDGESFMDERKVTPIRIPAGALMLSSINCTKNVIKCWLIVR